MRLDPKLVRYVTPFLSLSNRQVRFVGRENNIQLTETALVFEGNLLKLSLFGMELLFRRALAEWTAVTVPYSRIEKAKLTRWPAVRVVALVVVLLCLLFVLAVGLLQSVDPAAGAAGLVLVPAVVAGYALVRTRGRFVIRYRTKDGRRLTVLFHIKSKPAAREFDRRLQQYRAAAGKGGKR